MSLAMNVLTIFGTRPEAIKLAPVIKELERHIGSASRVCVTGQHRELLDQVLNVFDIKPDFVLNMMWKGRSLSEGSACTGCVRGGRAKGYRYRL